MGDKIMSPQKKESNRTGIVQAKSGIINGPTGSTGNLQPFNHGKKK